MFQNFGQQLYKSFIEGDRYMLYLQGLGQTMKITLGALLLGIILGSLVAIVKVYARDYKALRPLTWLCDIYVTIIRGTPMTVQLLIIYYVVFASAKFNMAPYIAMFAFGLNSGAYVSEIVRGGILAVDIGQTEAGRSLGLTTNQTMAHIVLPQAIKNILPALANEVVTLVKESSICSTMGMTELMFGAKQVASNTLITIGPYVMAGVIYFAINYPAGKLIEMLERRMRRGDQR
jgi:His/Glu/Gln/Arg/opine family amino acid ABC transporter permease subunit